MVSGSDTGAGTEGQSVALPGAFTQIPSPRVWSNGDDLSAGQFNKEWRDAFLWLLRKTSPAFMGHNIDATTLTIGAAIPIKVEDLKQGNLTHAVNDSKVYVWETGWYYAMVGMGFLASGATGTAFGAELMVNGALNATNDTVRVAGNGVGIQLLTDVYLTAGDYVEIAATGSWTGTATGSAGQELWPQLNLYWGSK
jgi:hypothetical protein